MPSAPNPKPIRIFRFDEKDPFDGLRGSFQLKYVRSYLSDLGAQTVIQEPYYFDRDYLAEFSTFYSTSTRGYENRCRRLHFFAQRFTRRVVENAAGGIRSSLDRLRDSYLGFTIIRPIPAAPLGRTVLRWYPERLEDTPRVTKPSRDYHVHFAGLKLTVHGLAWQQQDTGVGACATIGLWTMFHSSAFDDHHSIPTTSQITSTAHKQASFGNRVFPSTGLTVFQICEAIKAQDLAPVLSDGNVLKNGKLLGFGVERFASSCAAYIRSGYPVLLCGSRGGSKHAVCAVGFRSCAQKPLNKGKIGLQDEEIPYLYIHDDNIGPNVRFSIKEILEDGESIVALEPDAPNEIHPSNPYPRASFNLKPFIPEHLLVAVHEDLRTSPDVLHTAGMRLAKVLSYLMTKITTSQSKSVGGLTLSTRFIELADYMGRELERLLKSDKNLLSRVRMELHEKVPPMSLHLGLVRIALDDSTPLVDILYDTTDSDRNHPVFAHVAYASISTSLIQIITSSFSEDFGVSVEAY